jgi:hypothetical protein
MGRPPKAIETRWSASQPPGFIVPDALYTIEEVKARLRMGETVWRQLRRKGVKAIRFGVRHYIMGSVVIDALNRIAKEQEALGNASIYG